MAAAVAVVIAATIGLSPVQEARREKCAAIWGEVAPWSYDEDLTAYWCSEHERQGIAGEWYWSLVYGHANFGLVVGREVNGCYGPCDVRWAFAQGCREECRALARGRPWTRALLRDPYVNIRVHVAEMCNYRDSNNAHGLTLLRHVFLPAAPGASVVDDQVSLWQQTDQQFRRILRRMDKG